MRKLSFLAVILHAAALWTAGAYAADWPTKPVRVVSPFAAGGAADVIARLFSDALGKAFNQQFVVDNRTGAGGLVGAQTIARAEPDGYTLLAAGMSSHVLAPAISKNPGLRSGARLHPYCVFRRCAERHPGASFDWREIVQGIS